MIEAILVLNTGSSSLKFQAFERNTLERLMVGKVSGIGTRAILDYAVGDGSSKREDLSKNDHQAALRAALDCIDRNDDAWQLVAIAHRVVHGGTDFVRPVVVTDDILASLDAIAPLAPLHQPHNLAGIAASRQLAPGAIDIACFDTAFHATQDPLFQTFALPGELRAQGIRRYGFHGLSYEWIARTLRQDRPDIAEGRVIAAHLGNGASLCALRNGKSVDTTMGMTALDGLPMGSRCGALDPGLITHLVRNGFDVQAIERLLYEESGLKGLSGISNDVATLLASDDPAARFALDYFALKVAQFAAMMMVSLGGIDALVFSAGIGENAAPVRDAVVRRLTALEPFETLIIPTNEERMMAIHARDLLVRDQ